MDYILKNFEVVPNCFLLLGRWSFCYSTSHFSGSEVVMYTWITLAALWKYFKFRGNTYLNIVQ